MRLQNRLKYNIRFVPYPAQFLSIRILKNLTIFLLLHPCDIFKELFFSGTNFGLGI